MEIPELAELIWLLERPAGRVRGRSLASRPPLISTRPRRDIGPLLHRPHGGEAYISLYADGEEITYVKRLRRLGRLRADHKEPIVLQTKPTIRLSWDVKSLGEW